MKHVPRVVAAHGMEAALHVNNASGHTLADAVRGAPPETHSSEGGGVWAEYLPKAALMSNDLFLDDVNVLVPVWLGGRGDRPAFAMDATGFFGRYLFTVKHGYATGPAHLIKREIAGPAFSLSLTPIHSLRHRLVRSRQYA